MNILVVAATRDEISPLIAHLAANTQATANAESSSDLTFQLTKAKIDVLITGVGMVATAFALGGQLANASYDLAINLGIAGSLDRSIALGEVVEVTDDTFIELGAEDDECFITLDELGFGGTRFGTATRLSNYTTDRSIRQTTGITVNRVHGNERSIESLRQLTSAQSESMEGAAFFYACEQAQLPALQIRAVSNYVEKRDRNAWKIGLAVKELNTFAVELLERIDS